MEKQVLGSIAAMSIVIYAVKRIWKLPVEFRTHEREVEARFLEADARALKAELHRDAILEKQAEARSQSWKRGLEAIRLRDHDQLQAQNERDDVRKQEDREELALVDEEWNWPRGTTLKVEDMRRPTSVNGGSAVWTTED
jgi:hypothetical protein